MDDQTTPADEQVLHGRCRFCGAEVAEDADTCPECGHSVDEGLLVRPRKPLWTRILAAVFLVMLAAGLVVWVIHVIGLFK